DGDHWQSLRLNMAASSVRDLVIKDDDVVVGTHGRGIWILDDITPLREIEQTTADRDVVLFKPQNAWRVRWNTNTDTPLPPDEPAAPNPPEGAIIDYYLKAAAAGPVTLEITGADGRLVRRYSSTDEIFKPNPATITVPLYWFRDIVPAPTTPWVNPGTYTVKLTVDGKSYIQPIVVQQDPRVKTPALVMQQVYTLSKGAYYAAVDAAEAARQVRKVSEQLSKLRPQVMGAAVETLGMLEDQVEALEPGPERGVGFGAVPTRLGGTTAGSGPPPDSLSGVSASLAALMNLLQGADVRPTTVQVNALTAARAAAERTLAKWRAVKTVDLPALNAQLKAAGLPAVTP